MSEVCKHCHAFKVFGEKCWFFWQGKKSCSQFKRAEADEPQFFSIELLPDDA